MKTLFFILSIAASFNALADVSANLVSCKMTTDSYMANLSKLRTPGDDGIWYKPTPTEFVIEMKEEVVLVKTKTIFAGDENEFASSVEFNNSNKTINNPKFKGNVVYQVENNKDILTMSEVEQYKNFNYTWVKDSTLKIRFDKNNLTAKMHFKNHSYHPDSIMFVPVRNFESTNSFIADFSCEVL